MSWDDMGTSFPLSILCQRSEAKRRKLEVKILALALSLLYYSFKVVTGVIGGIIWMGLSAATALETEPATAGS